jgi:hypothetical protein
VYSGLSDDTHAAMEPTRESQLVGVNTLRRYFFVVRNM